jgi:hypothetical protein
VQFLPGTVVIDPPSTTLYMWNTKEGHHILIPRLGFPGSSLLAVMP